MRVPHPIPYQGSKRAFASQIVALFPDDSSRLIEPFAGSAAVALAAVASDRIENVSLSDSNQPLMRLWRDIICYPVTLTNAYEQLWWRQIGREKKFYNAVRKRFNQTQRTDYFLYLLARCVKASIRYNPKGEFNQSPDNRRKGAKPTEMKARIFGAASLLSGRTELASVDYQEALINATPTDIVYMDPPYAGVSKGKDRRYAGTISFVEETFVETLASLNDRGISFMVSYDGRTGGKIFGPGLPEALGLTRKEIHVGRSSQATLLGRDEITVESLYLSPSLVRRLGHPAPLEREPDNFQYSLVSQR